MTRRSRGSASHEHLLLTLLVALAAVPGLRGVGGAYHAALAASASGVSAPAHTMGHQPSFGPAAQAGLASVVSRVADGLVWLGESFRSRSGVAGNFVFEADARPADLAAKPGVTALRNSTERVAALPGTVHVADLPPKPEGAYRFVSFNSATGSHDVRFRDPANRTRAGRILGQADADAIALQEVDFGNPRSGGGNTALEMVQAFSPSFERFGDGTGKRGIEVQEDGARIHRSMAGTLVSGRSTVVRECRTAMACAKLMRQRVHGIVEALRERRWPESFQVRPVHADYGTATYLGPRYELMDAFVDVLNSKLDEDWPRAYRDAEHLGDPGRNRLNIRRREAYPRYQAKDAKRTWKRAEPRAALVTVARAENGEVHAIINTHLALEDGVREANIDHIARLAETQLEKGRRVFVLGDFNENSEALARRFESVGLRRVAGSDIDVVWASDPPARVLHGADLHTDGTSDHAVAAVATVR